MSTRRGRFVWYDLITTDPVDAKRFYGALVGWGTAQYPHEPPYTMWTVGDVPIGGIFPVAPSDSASPFWHAYITTPDTDATVREAEKLGARAYVGPKDIPTVGRFAMVKDAEGAVFAPFTPSMPDRPESGDPPPIGHFSWNELAATDPDKALAFYRALFAWQVTGTFDMGQMGIYSLIGYDTNPMMIGGIYRKPPVMPGPAAWLHYIKVADVDAAAVKVPGLGGTVTHGPSEVPGGDRIVQCRDPQGAAFALHSAKRG
jgi:uncharacterized protein